MKMMMVMTDDLSCQKDKSTLLFMSVSMAVVFEGVSVYVSV